MDYEVLAMPRQAMPSHATPRQAMPRHATPRREYETKEKIN
jgi:hypothetical protein